MKPVKRILRLDASATPATSSSIKLGDLLLDKLCQSGEHTSLRQRDIGQGLPLINSDWIEANFTPEEERDDAQQNRLAFSNGLIAELQWADHIVLTTPMYNFSVPAAVKAWIDLVCRAGITFRYTENGPVGLLENKSVDIIVTTGGVPLESPADFVSGYLKQVFGFIGLKQVNIIGADQMNTDAEQSMARARQAIDKKYPAMAA